MKRLRAGMLLSNALVFTFNQDAGVCTLTPITASAGPPGAEEPQTDVDADSVSSKTSGTDAPNKRLRFKRHPPPSKYQCVAKSSSYIRGWDTAVPGLRRPRPHGGSQSVKRKA